MKLTPDLRIRLQAARRSLATRYAIAASNWSDDQMLSALSLANTGLGIHDAAAVVMGDAVIENGRVDYDPGCAWIDFMLARRTRTLAECERILAQWESPCQHDASAVMASNVVALPIAIPQSRERVATGR